MLNTHQGDIVFLELFDIFFHAFGVNALQVLLSLEYFN